MHLFFKLVSRGYETGEMLITSNRSVADSGTRFLVNRPMNATERA